ncbi:hypothetical protein NCS56_01428500 [Fusarium sp. Ph1]|nr:hypothetical protein NCS56_01428500 [Fusarium sp. Ph1]
MLRKYQLEMSSFESLSIDRDPWSRETSHEQTKPPAFGFPKYSTLSSTAEDPYPQSTTTTATSFQDPRARDIVETLGHLALFHLPSVAITLAILALYIARVRWPHPTAEQLSILQFVAKGHEILILVSLADVLMYRVCFGLLVDKNGVPLGFLSSPFQLGAPTLYLLSWELWSAILQPGANHSRARPRIPGFIIIIAILLSLAAAPLPAFVIIPRGGWKQVHIQPKEDEVITYVKAKLYETDLDSKHVDLYQVHANTQPSQQDLFRMLIPTIDDPPDKEEFSRSRLISLTMDFQDLESSFMAIATTPMSAVADQLGRYWKEKPTDVLTKSYRKSLNSSEVKRWKQPLVAVECAPNKTAGSKASFSFDSNIAGNNVLLDIDKDSSFKKLLKNARRKKSPRLGYQIVDLSDRTKSSISAAMVFVTDDWKADDGTPLQVRVVGDEGRIEMMLRQRGRSTGQDQELEEEDNNEREVTRVQPGVKYH